MAYDGIYHSLTFWRGPKSHWNPSYHPHGYPATPTMLHSRWSKSPTVDNIHSRLVGPWDPSESHKNGANDKMTPRIRIKMVMKYDEIPYTSRILDLLDQQRYLEPHLVMYHPSRSAYEDTRVIILSIDICIYIDIYIYRYNHTHINNTEHHTKHNIRFPRRRRIFINALPKNQKKHHNNNHLHPLLIWFIPWAPRMHFFQRRHCRHLGPEKKKQLGLVDTEVDSPGKNCIKCYILCYIAIDPEPYLGKYDSWNSWFQNTGKKPEKGRMRMTINYPFGEVNMFFVIFLLNLQSVVFPVILSILMICPLWGLGVNKLSSSHSLSRPSK